MATQRLEQPTFYWLATVALVVGIFARAQEVLVPLALAVVIAFALTPVVKTVERKTGRGLAVAMVVLVGLALVGGFGYLLQKQLVDLSGQMNQYSESMRKKIASLRGDGSGLAGLSAAVEKMVLQLDETVAETKEARPVKVIPEGTSGIGRLEAMVTPALKPLAGTLIVLVLVIFLLMQREDLRDRFIRLAGKRRVTLTTRTLDEAGLRVSHFLLTQSAINATFGLFVALGLLWIGIPYAPLWGFVAAMLRFVPFIGSLLAMLFPAMLSFAQFEGWWHTGMTVGLFVALDLVTAYGAEPVIIGRRTGVSSMAMLVSAIFWTWLWGAAGLVLSTPMTVCLVVVGRHVPRLQFLSVLLSDAPALDRELVLYQRLLSGDEDEANETVEKALRTLPREEVLDTVIIPAVLLAERDRASDEINKSDHENVLRVIANIVEHQPATTPLVGAAAATPAAQSRPHILGVPAHNTADELVWSMFSQLLDPARFTVESLSAATLVSEAVEAAVKGTPELICITSVPPGGLVHVRHLCKRLNDRLPNARILIIRPGVNDDAQLTRADKLIQDGATGVAFTLADARARANQLLLLDSSTPVPVPVAAQSA